MIVFVLHLPHHHRLFSFCTFYWLMQFAADLRVPLHGCARNQLYVVMQDTVLRSGIWKAKTGRSISTVVV